MSIDLDWLKLDASLANHVVDILNRQLDSAERPSFIGPVQVTSLDFGSNAPDVELIDLRDIYRDFLEDDDDEDHEPVKVTEGGMNGGIDDDEGYEWVSRRAGVRRDSAVSGAGTNVWHHGYGAEYFSAGSMPSMDPWTSGLSRPPSFGSYGMPPLGSAGTDVHYRSPSPATPFAAAPSPSRLHRSQKETEVDPRNSITGAIPASVAVPQPSPYQPQPQDSPPNPHPNLQLHFQIKWRSNLRISLQTSLRINYPSPMFMSLPIRLSVTGLDFNGELAVAYEGERRRIHICVLDDLDPYGPAGARRFSGLSADSNPSLSQTSPSAAGATTGGTFIDKSTTSKLNDASSMAAPALGIGGLNSLGDGITTFSLSNPRINNSSSACISGQSGHEYSVTHARLTKPVLPIGQRLLPSIFIESEIGQADKHVLKNVARVEKFIQDVIRKTVEEELVFPNFHTMVMGDNV